MRKHALKVAVALQVCFLFTVVGLYYVGEWVGDTVRLEMQVEDWAYYALDHGDTVYLRYVIQEIPVAVWEGKPEPNYNDPVFVVLEADGQYHRVVRATAERPQITADQVVLKGKVSSVIQNRRWIDTGESVKHREPVQVDPYFTVSYSGLERYVVSRAEARGIEENGLHSYDVLLKATPWGQVNLSGLVVRE